MGFKAVIFDLDGTLLDTLDDITDAVNTVMERLGFPIHEKVAVRSFVGSGLRSLMGKAIPESEHSESVVDLCFREMMNVYSENYKEKTKPYPGILNMLNCLVERKIPMSVFSNKADELTRKLVDSVLPINFVSVQGMTTEALKKPNPKVALELARKMAIMPEECVYVGDSGTDMVTANNAGMYAIGVTWGFRDRDNLIRSGAKKLVDSPDEILRFF